MKSELVIVESHNLQTHLNLTVDLIGSFGKMLMMMSYGTCFLWDMFPLGHVSAEEIAQGRVRARLYYFFFLFIVEISFLFLFLFFNNFVYTYLLFFSWNSLKLGVTLRLGQEDCGCSTFVLPSFLRWENSAQVKVRHISFGTDWKHFTN